MSADDDPELAAIRARLMADILDRTGAADAPAPAPAPAPALAWPEGPVEVTDASFLETVNKYPLVLVDFWAPWCGPCRRVAPVVEELAREMRGSVAFLKLNTDESPRTAATFGIESIPTLLVFKDGKPVDGIVGAQPKGQIAAVLRRQIQRRGAPGPRRL